jgi:hypothetical protein
MFVKQLCTVPPPLFRECWAFLSHRCGIVRNNYKYISSQITCFHIPTQGLTQSWVEKSNMTECAKKLAINSDKPLPQSPFTSQVF